MKKYERERIERNERWLAEVEALGYLAGRPGNREELNQALADLDKILVLADKDLAFRRRLAKAYGEFMKVLILALDRRSDEVLRERAEALVGAHREMLEEVLAPKKPKKKKGEGKQPW